MRIGFVMIVVVATACRWGFPEQPDATSEPPPDAPPPILTCMPKRFTIGGTIKYLAAAPTTRGFAVFVGDDHGAVRGFSYDVTDETVEAQASTGITLNVPAAVDALAAVTVSASKSDRVEVMLAVPYGNAAPAEVLGTGLVPFDAQLVRVDAPKLQDHWIAGEGSLAAGDGDEIAYLGISKDNGQLEARTATRLGSGSSTTHAIDTRGHSFTRPTIIRGAGGYLVSWQDNASMPTQELDAALLGDQLAAGPTQTINADPNNNSLVPAAGYSASAKKYLFAWAVKHNGDSVLLRMRDEQLADAPGMLDFLEIGYAPKIAGGDKDFVVAWDNGTQQGGPPGAARVLPDGSVSVRGVTNTGGKAARYTWDLVVRNGQPVLIWAEQGGSGPDLWIDALCDD